MKILIAEDEPDMQRILRLYLEREGYEVSVAANGEDAFTELCKAPYDLLIADWMMPKMNGLQLCKEVRSYALPVKIMMLTAKSENEDEIAGLTCGADDYIKKPFEPKILLLRIRRMFQLDDVITCGRLALNTKNQTVLAGNKELRLTQKEFLLLQLFMRNKGIVLSRELLLDRIWGNDYEGDERTLDTHIRRLRSKIGKEYITTFIGMGYRMDDFSE